MRYLICLTAAIFIVCGGIAHGQDEAFPIITAENADEVRLLGTFWHPDVLIISEFSPNGRFLSSFNYPYRVPYKDIYIWDMETMSLYNTINLESSPEQIRFNPTSESMAIQTWDTVDLWDLTTSSFTLSFSPASPLLPLVFSPDGTLLAAGDDFTPTIHLWNVNTGEEFDSLELGDLLAYDLNENILAAGNFNGVTLFNYISGEIVGTLATEEPVAEVFFTPNGTTLLTQSETYNPYSLIYRFIDIDTLRERATFTEWSGGGWTDGFYGYVLSSHLSPDGNTFGFNAGVAETGEYLGVTIVDVPSGEVRFQTAPSYCRPTNVIFSFDDRLLAVCTDEEIQILDMTTGTQISSIPVDTSEAQAFSQDGSILAILNCEGGEYPVQLWDTLTGTQLAALPGRCENHDDILFSPDGSMLLVNSGQLLMLYGIPTGQRTAYGSVPGRIAPSVINIRAAPSLEAEITGEISGDVAVGGRDESNQFLYLSSHNGWVRAGEVYVDLGAVPIEDLPILRP